MLKLSGTMIEINKGDAPPFTRGCNADENQKIGAGGTALTYEEAKAEMIAAAWRYWLDPDEEAAYAAKALAACASGLF